MLCQLPLAVTPHELLVEAVAFGSLGVGVGDVVDGDRLGAMVTSDPVSIGQVDADGGGRVGVATEDGGSDHLCGDPFHLFLLEAVVDGRVVFEPLGIVADCLGSFGSLLALEVDHRLPGGFQAEGIGIGLNEAVDEVDTRLGVGYPFHRVVVECFQIAAPVIIDQQGDHLFLMVVFGYCNRFLQPSDDSFDRLVIHAAQLPDLFGHLTVDLAHFAVESIGERCLVGRILHSIVECFHLLLGNPLVEVDCRGGHDVAAGSLAHAFGHHCRVEHHRQDLIEGLIGSHPVAEGHPPRVDALHKCYKVVLCELRHDLVFRVVVVDAIGHPYLLQVGLELFPLIGRLVAHVVFIHPFTDAADGEVVTVVLVPEDVTTLQGCL